MADFSHITDWIQHEDEELNYQPRGENGQPLPPGVGDNTDEQFGAVPDESPLIGGFLFLTDTRKYLMVHFLGYGGIRLYNATSGERVLLSALSPQERSRLLTEGEQSLRHPLYAHRAILSPNPDGETRPVVHQAGEDQENTQATRSWRGPTQEELESPLFQSLWDTIRTWDINVPEVYRGYCGANGSHVVAIMEAILGQVTLADLVRAVPLSELASTIYHRLRDEEERRTAAVNQASCGSEAEAFISAGEHARFFEECQGLGLDPDTTQVLWHRIQRRRVASHAEVDRET